MIKKNVYIVEFDQVKTYENFISSLFVITLLSWDKNPGMEPVGMIPLLTVRAPTNGLRDGTGRRDPPAGFSLFLSHLYTPPAP